MKSKKSIGSLAKNDALHEQIQAEKQIGFPSDFVFKPIQQKDVDEESSLFYSSEQSSD